MALNTLKCNHLTSLGLRGLTDDDNELLCLLQPVTYFDVFFSQAHLAMSAIDDK